MADFRKHSSTSNIFRFKLTSSADGTALTGLTSASSGLIISTVCDNEATATAYTAAGSTIEAVSVLGTFAAPTATKCRFSEVDATNHPGLYEFQFADARFSVASAKRLVISVSGVSGLFAADYEVQLTQTDVYDAVRAGMTALPNAAPDAPNGLPISDAGGLDLDALLGTLTSLVAETRDANMLDQFRRLIAVVEHQRGGHTHQPIGNVLFVDPTNGDTHANGNRGGITDPYSLVQDCHDNAVTDSNHDLIILLSGAAAGATTLTEDVTISKRYLFIRGPGRDFIWTRSGAGDTINITADGIELSGFQVNTAGTGSGNGITVTSADFFAARHLWLNDTQGDAIELTDCDNFVIDKCVLQGSGQSGSGHGIQVVAGNSETSDYGVIRDCYIHDVAGDGIQLDTTGGGSNNSTMIHGNIIEGCTDDGIDIVDSGTVGTVIQHNVFGNNTSNDIEDAGTNTVVLNNEQWATPTNITAGTVTTVSGNVDGSVASVANIPVDGTFTVTLADAVTHGGTSAMLRLGSSSTTPALHVTNTDTGFNSHAAHFFADAGAGMLVDGGNAATIFVSLATDGFYAGGNVLISAAAVADRVWEELIADHSGTPGSTAEALEAIQTDLDNGTDGLGALKTDTAAIKVITDQFVFTVANQVDANTLSVGGTAQTAGNLSAQLTQVINVTPMEAY